MRVLVTGGAGFVGSHLVEGALGRGLEVAVLDDLSRGRREHVPSGVALFEVDLRDRAAVLGAVGSFRPRYIVHAAAQSLVQASLDDPARDAEINVVGGLHLLEAARRAQAKLVFTSTGGAIYGEVDEPRCASEAWPVQPKSPYAASKAAFELYLEVFSQSFGLEYAVLRYANVYGPRQDPEGEAGVVAIFAQRVLGGAPVTVYGRRTPGDGGCMRDYVYVSDVVEASLRVLDLHGVFNVGAAVGHTTREVFEAVCHAAGRRSEVRDAPPRPGELGRSVLDNGKLRQLGWAPEVSFSDGIARTVHWLDGQR